MNEQSPQVGYRNPPTHTRFKKGQSGNPRGRPKKKDISFGEALRNELEEIVAITENGRAKRITKQEYLAKKLVEQATKSPGFFRQLLAAMDKHSVTEPLPPSPEEIAAISDEEAQRLYELALRE